VHIHAPARPVLLGPNQPPGRPYRGGPGIARLRGTADTRLDVPEDFLASTTEVAAGGGVGLSTLPDGRTLREHIQANPEAYLGPRHVAAFGADPALLVKLLDTAERLFVHVHPDDDFAARHLNCRFGKTEAWYVVEVPEGRTGEVYLGFRRDVDLAEVRGWVQRQDTEALLGVLNRVEVRPGDAVLVPAGTPHAIGAGLTVVELQEPTDFSILLEWSGYGVGPQDADLGLGMETALAALDRSGWSPERLATVTAVTRRPTERPGVTRLFPPVADRFFRAEHLDVSERTEFPAEFAVLVVLSGSGLLRAGADTVALRRGSVLLVPYAAGTVHLLGELEAIRCLLPETP
jgi:mannose-6-phosphate isomerase